MSIDLRPYQSNLVDNTRLSLAGGKRRVGRLPTHGRGQDAHRRRHHLQALAKGRKVVFVANRKQLVLQTSGVLHGLGIAHGILQADNTRNLDARVLVASIDTVHLRGLPDDIGLIIIDECHSVAGSAKLKQIMFSRNLVPVIGLTATPFAAGMAVCFRQRCKTPGALRKPPQHGGDLASGGCSGEQEERRDPAAVRLSRAALQPRWRRQPRRGPAPRYSSKASTRTDRAQRSPHGAVE
jgi:hypothetical protein